MTRVSLSLLGPLLINLDGRPLEGFESNRVRALLMYLAVEAAYPHRRDVLAGLLWPEQSEQRARKNLRQALSNLRQTLHDRDTAQPLLHITPATVQLVPDGDYHLDVAAFAASVAACERHPHRNIETCHACLRRLEHAAALYRGSFLHGFFLADSAPFEDWVALTRERLHRLAVETLSHLATAYERRGQLDRAITYGRRLLELDPWQEEAHRGVMQVLFQNGQRNAALAQFDACRRVLAEALGVEPEEETVALYDRIRDSAPVAITPGLANARYELPPQPASFVGREDELRDLAEMLSNPARRLVTISGPGGIGKTRLALEAAAQQGTAFADGVVFVPLAGLGSVELLVAALAAALHLSLQADQDPKQQLLETLRTREVLLVLDNFEHVLPGAALLAELLEQSSCLTLLVTSRERLDLQWEWVYDLEGLTYPPGAANPDPATYSALELFEQRARQGRRLFVMEGAEAHAAAEICRLVEGMPLAIELAAALVRERTCQEIAEQVATGIGDLAVSFRDKPVRHRSMRAVFDHSWHLLASTEQRVLRGLSVFRGGFDVDAAETVAGATRIVVSSLVAKSLVRAGEGAGTSRRHDLHEAMRQYAFEQLQAAGEVEALRQRHAGYFLVLAECAEPELTGAQQAEWFRRLEHEHDNLHAALAGAVEQGDGETVARISGALRHFWEGRGNLSEGRRWLEQALSAGAPLPHVLRAKVLHGAGALAFYQGDVGAARGHFEAGLALCRAADDRQGVASMLNGLGNVAFNAGHTHTARAMYEESLALMRSLNDHGGSALALNNLGTIAWAQGDFPAARAMFDESLALQRKVGDEWGVGYALNNLGSIATAEGEYAVAYTLLAESVAILQQVGDKRAIASTLEEFAILASAQSNSERALRLAGAAAAVRTTISAPSGVDNNVTLEEHVARARQALSETASAAAWEEGQAMVMEQAIVYALGEDVPEI